MPAGVQAPIVDADVNEPRSAPADGILRLEVASPQRPDFFSGFHPPNTLVHDFNNIKESGAPARFLFFRGGSWIEFSRQVFDDLSEAFLHRKTAVEAEVDGEIYLFEFFRLLRTHLKVGAQNSIAWIDIDGRCFFPKFVVDGKRSMACHMLPIEIKLNNSRDLLMPPEERSDESPDCSSVASFDSPRWPDALMLKDTYKIYKEIQKFFLSEMTKFDPDTVITSISRCSRSSPNRDSRLESFNLQMNMMKVARGNANVKSAWYGAPKDVVAEVIAYGFGQPNSETFGNKSCGVGVHLSPVNSPYTSALLSEADSNGEWHVVLCRVIMGNSERVPAGSPQFQSSGKQFDSGVDDLVKPRWYIVWSTDMNTRILPEYVVSFKSSKKLQGSHSVNKLATNPQVTIAKLFAEIGRSLSSSKMKTLKALYIRFKTRKICKDMLIKHTRSIVGDELLRTIITRIQGHR